MKWQSSCPVPFLLPIVLSGTSLCQAFCSSDAFIPLMNILIIGGSGQDSFYLSSSLLNSACVVTCAHRSIHLYPPPSSRLIKHYRVKEYSFECLKSLFLSEEFDAVVVIAGPVGNRLATQDPIGCYLQSTKIVLAVFDLVPVF